MRPLVTVLALGLVLISISEPASAELLPPPPPWATGQSRDEDLSISLITFGPGTEIISWFGHTALVVEDRAQGRARLYNYGLFTFDATMLARFASGRLEFWVGEAPVGPTLDLYRAEKRDVRVQMLSLLPSERGHLARLLAENVLPQNREYLYDHYRDNCSTRPRDIVDKAIGGQLLKATSGRAPMTLRQQTQRYTRVNPVMSVLLDFWMNADIDRPMPVSGAAFLPEELERQLASFRYTNAEGQVTPLVEQTFVVSRSERPRAPEDPPRYEGTLLALGLLLGAIPLLGVALGRSRWPLLGRRMMGLHSAAIGLALGIPGLIGVLFWLCTNHVITYCNENLLMANPLTLLAVPWGWKWARRGAVEMRSRLCRLWPLLAGLGLCAPALKLLPHPQQDNGRILAIALPVLVGSAAAWWLNRSQIPAS